MELIGPSTSVIRESAFGKCCSRLDGTCGNAITTKHGQLVLKKGDHSTPKLSHWAISLVQGSSLPPLQYGCV